jgi:ribonuclease HI
MARTLFPDSKFIVYTDGGSRGNPGPAAAGVIVGGKPYGEYLGTATNNVAEYKAVIFALKKAKQILGKTKAKETDVEVRLDSELVQRQMVGRYRIEEPDLKPLFVDVWNLKMNFKSVLFVHVPREKNREADRMVNEMLNKS